MSSIGTLVHVDICVGASLCTRAVAYAAGHARFHTHGMDLNLQRYPPSEQRIIPFVTGNCVEHNNSAFSWAAAGGGMYRRKASGSSKPHRVKTALLTLRAVMEVGDYLGKPLSMSIFHSETDLSTVATSTSSSVQTQKSVQGTPKDERVCSLCGLLPLPCVGSDPLYAVRGLVSSKRKRFQPM